MALRRDNDACRTSCVLHIVLGDFSYALLIPRRRFRISYAGAFFNLSLKQHSRLVVLIGPIQSGDYIYVGEWAGETAIACHAPR